MSKVDISKPERFEPAPRPYANNGVEQAFGRLKLQTRQGNLGGTFRKRRPDPNLVETSGFRWVCARVMPGREFVVADYLDSVGFRTFCPHGVKVYQRARVNGSDQRRRAERDYSVFGSYVFVGEPEGLFVSKHTHWYIADVLQGAGCRYIPPVFVEMASAAWKARRWDERVKAEDRFVGKAVRIVSGPMQGWEAVVDKLPNEVQAIVTVKMFGSMRPVTVDLSSLNVV